MFNNIFMSFSFYRYRFMQYNWQDNGATLIQCLHVCIFGLFQLILHSDLFCFPALTCYNKIIFLSQKFKLFEVDFRFKHQLFSYQMTEQIQDVMAMMEKQFDSSFNQSAQKQTNLQQLQPFPNSDTQHTLISNHNSNQPQQNNEIQQNIKNRQQQQKHSSNQDSNQESPYKKNFNTSTSIQVINHQIQNNQHKKRSSESPSHQLDYKTLQTKIETVLKKNQKYKDLATTSRMNKNSSALMLSRFQQYQKKKQRSIEAKKHQLQNYEVRQLKQKPTINANSKKIIEQVGYTPIFERFQRLMQSKKKKQQESQQNKKAQIQQQYQKFIQQFKSNEKVPDGIRSYDDFYEQMVRWKERAEKHTQQRKNQIQQRMKINHPFRPKLNQNSVKLTQAKKRVPVHQRQITLKQTQLQYSFKPKINKKRVK